MHGDSHDRYERLTSVSSSVDFDQRDNVSALPQTRWPHVLLLLQGRGLGSLSLQWCRVKDLWNVTFSSARATLVSEPQADHPDLELLALYSMLTSEPAPA